MANKRQNAESKALIPPKKVKAATTEFNGTVFKSMLKDPSKAFKGLGTFVQMAKQLPCADMYDVVEGYIKISAECAEIFLLLDGDSHSETELVLIFQSLELILLRTASDLSHFSVVGSTIVKKTVCTHMKLLQSTLSSGNYQLVRRCLCLMTAMVSQGTEAAHEILSSLVFSRTLSNLARLRDKAGRPDVRMAYVQFALSFLMYGDSSSIGQILESRDFLSEILNSGLKEDRLSIVCLILSTLQTKVVQNMAVSKTQKLRFFSASTLIQIASLYRWNGIVDATTDYTERMNEQEAGGHHVREMVHSFLLELCCSRKYGISFHNPSLGTAGRAGNIVLLQFAVSLKQAVDDEKVAELLVSILKANPDILQRYFKETHLSFSPRMKDIWLQSVGLLRKIYEAQSDVSSVFQSRQTGSASCLLSMVLVTSLPPVCNKTFFTQGLNLPGVVGQHATLSVLAFILRRAQRNMEHAVSSPVLDRFEAQGFNPMREFIQLYKEALSKILPDITSIVSKWQSLSKKETAEPKGTEGDKSERDPKLILFKALLLQVICLYQKVVPHLVAESKFDFSKLLKGIVSERGLREDVPPVLQYQILHLALELPASKFSWFCLQDRAGPDQDRGEGSVLYVLLKVFVSCSSSQLQSMSRMLILKVLRESGVFEHTWRELELWLDHLLGLDSSQQETVLHFLEQVLMKAVCNPYVYIDKVAVILQEAVCLQAEGRRQGGNTGTVPLSDTDDASGLLLIKECGGTVFKEVGVSVSQDALPPIFPFSAAVPAVMEARNKMLINAQDPEGVVCEYTCAVLCDVLHSQTDPLALCLMLQHYDTELLSSQIPPLPQSALAQFHLYYSKWLSKQPQVLQFGPVQTAVASPSLGHPAFLKSCYMEGPDTFLQDSFWSGLEESLSTLELSQYPGVMSQTLIYLRSYVERFSSLPKSQALEVLGSMLKVLHTLFLKLHSAVETPPAPPEAQQDEERDLEMSFSSVQEVNKQQVLLAVSRAVFKHPVLVQWFLAVELGAVPAPSLYPQRARQLCARLTDGVLTLLRCCAETLRDLQALELISPYLSSTHRALLRELQHSTSVPVADSRSVKSFLTLHGYMEPSCVNEVVSALLVLPRSRLLADGDGLSVYGRAALTVLTESVGHALPGKDAPCLSQLHLHNLGALYTSCHSQQLAQLLLQVLSRESSYAKLVPVDVLLHCLWCPCSPELSAVLVQNCSTHCLSFELWCLDQSDLTDLTAQNGGFHPVLISYLQLTAAEDPCRLRDVQKAVLQKITKTLLPELLSSVLQLEDGSSLEQSVSLLSHFIQLGLGAPDLTRLIHDLPGILQKPDTSKRWPLADSITQRLVGTPEEQPWRKSLVAASLRWLSSTYREQKTSCVREEEEILQRIRTLMMSGEDVTDLDWNTFVKLGLKYRYRGGRFMETLRSLLEIVYQSENTQGFLPLKTLHMMLTSHSLFLPTMLAPPDEAECGPESKEALVSLLFMLVRKCPEVCITNHFHVLLGAYGATLDPTDQKLLLLLKEYERNNISLVEFQCLLWGQAAVEYHKAQRSLGSTLWTQLSSEKLLEQLDSDRMLNTITFFPLRLRLVSQENEELISVSTQFCPDQVFLYDPSFLIPLFSYIVRPESVLDCRKFVSSHALGVTLVALSSYDHNMRAAAYHVLGSLYQHLEGAYFKEKKQLLYLLDIIRNGIQKQNLRVSFLHSTYMTKVAQLILKPEEHMYLVVNRFILATPYVDLKRVPDFFRLFYSFDTEHKLEREWLLKVLEDGVRDELSYDLCEQQGIYHVLLGFCSSPLSDPSVQNQIVSLLRRTAYIKKAASDLIKAHGILKWIVQLTEKRFIEQRMLSSVIGLLHTLWFTNLDTNDRWKHKRNPGQELQSDSPIKSLPYSFTTDFLCALLKVIKHLRTEVEVADLQRFLQSLESVLQHHGMAAGTRGNTDWLMMQPQTLSCSAALGLLHCWGTLDCDTKLLCDLRDLASRHHVKAVPGIGKESMEGKAKCNTENNVKSLLECRQLLVNIFTHWEPCSSQPNLNLTEVPLDKPGLSDSNILINETAHILIKWTLQTLSETPYDETSIFSTLKWLQIVLVPREAVVKSLLGDEAVRVNLLRLYLQTCESGKQKQSGFRLDMVQRFTEMMLHLLNVDKSPSIGVLPTSVIGACLHPPADEAGTREAGLKLLSLYIHDLWNQPHHDAVPQILLTHARLLTRHGKKSSKKSRPPIMYICEEILSSVECAESL